MKNQKLNTDETILLVDSHHGTYTPLIFANNFGENIVEGKPSEDDYECLLVHENEWYWETWEQVLNNVIIEIDGRRYYLHHDEDLWAIPEEMDVPELI